MTDDSNQGSRDNKPRRRAYGTGGIFTVKNADGTLTYYISYSVGGKPVKESTRSSRLADAERLLHKRMGEVQEGALAGSPLRVTVNQLLDDLLTLYKVKGKASEKTIKGHMVRLRRTFGSMKAMQLKQPRILKAVAEWKEERSRHFPDGLQTTTINRHLETLRRAYWLGVENGRIGAGMVPNFGAIDNAANRTNARQTYHGVADIDRLISELPQDIDDFVDWLYGSSQRWGEAALMEWAWFTHATWEIRVPGSDTKNEDPRVYPVEKHLRPIIMRRLAARRLDCPYIFHKNGKQIPENWVPDYWQPACVRAGLGAGKRKGSITPHDLRHLAATDMRRSGIPESLIMQIGGWKTASMFRRYAITDTQEIADNLGKLAAYRAAERKKAAKVAVLPNVPTKTMA